MLVSGCNDPVLRLWKLGQGEPEFMGRARQRKRAVAGSFDAGLQQGWQAAGGRRFRGTAPPATVEPGQHFSKSWKCPKRGPGWWRFLLGKTCWRARVTSRASSELWQVDKEQVKPLRVLAGHPQAHGACVYATLKDWLATRKLAPDDKLSLHELAAAFGVSRSPVQQALTRLVSEARLGRAEAGALRHAFDTDDRRERPRRPPRARAARGGTDRRPARPGQLAGLRRLMDESRRASAAAASSTRAASSPRTSASTSCRSIWPGTASSPTCTGGWR